MATDLLSETRISLNLLSREQDVALSTSWRWTLRGIKGHRLESFNVGGRKFTTREAFARFVAATNGEPVAPVPNAQRARDRQSARAELAAAGLID